MIKELALKNFTQKEDYILNPISSLNAGDICKLEGRISVNKKKTSKGAEYYQIVISDTSNKNINTIVFNQAKELYTFLEENPCNNCKGTIYTKITQNGQYKNMEIHKIELEFEDPLSEEEVSEKSENVMELIFDKINHIVNPGLKAICEHIYSNPSFVKKFSVAPATEFSAYNYCGGLGQMTVQTAIFAEEIASAINCDTTYENSLLVDTDLLITGALLCNIGRTFTLEFDETCSKINKTEYGILENDLAIARTSVLEAIKEVKAIKDEEGNPKYELKKDTILELLHMVDSCKGQLAWGAIAVPRTKHAMLLSNVTSLVYTKGLFENLEKSNEGERFVKAYDNGRNYFLPTSNME